MNITELERIMVEYGVALRAIPSTVCGIYEKKNAEKYPDGEIKFLEAFKREMLITKHIPKNAGKVRIVFRVPKCHLHVCRWHFFCFPGHFSTGKHSVPRGTLCLYIRGIQVDGRYFPLRDTAYKSLMEGGHCMERYFPEHRVRYIFLPDGIDTGVDSTANDITPFRAIMNDMYAKDISKKISSVKHDKQRKGLFIGGKPVYGYKMHPTEKNRIVIDEDAAPMMRRILGMALEGVSCRKIASQLNEEGIPAPATHCGWDMGRKGPFGSYWSV